MNPKRIHVIFILKLFILVWCLGILNPLCYLPAFFSKLKTVIDLQIRQKQMGTSDKVCIVNFWNGKFLEYSGKLPKAVGVLLIADV